MASVFSNAPGDTEWLYYNVSMLQAGAELKTNISIINLIWNTD